MICVITHQYSVTNQSSISQEEGSKVTSSFNGVVPQVASKLALV